MTDNERNRVMGDRLKFRVWDKRFNRYQNRDDDALPMLMSNGNLAYLNDKAMENYVIEQCTGLKDKNGDLIFEGDILQFSDRNILEVFFYSSDGCLKGKIRVLGQKCNWIVNLCEEYLYDCSLKIIGNIHENKELLKGE